MAAVATLRPDGDSLPLDETMPMRAACVDDYDSLWAWRSVDDIAVEKGELRNEGPGPTQPQRARKTSRACSAPPRLHHCAEAYCYVAQSPPRVWAPIVQ